MRPRYLAAVAVLAISTWGCASGTGAGSTDSGRSGDVITREELDRTSVDNALEAVTVLRPQWLRARPARTMNDPSPEVGVVVDGRPRGTKDDLALIRAVSIERIEFMSATDATIRYGTGFAGGAIVVTTRS